MNNPVSILSHAGGDTVSLRDPPPLSLYIHVPWCVRKCPYCDFNSHEADGEVPEGRYIRALERDLETALPLVWGRKVQTVFFGGGTPSLLSAEGVDGILTMVRTLMPLDSYAEVTLEANPGTFEAARFRGYREAGINRLSVGIQSFNDRHLRALGRIHGAKEAHGAVEIALREFERVNLDLMYALPGQTLAEARADIRAAVAWDPGHLSAYHLTIEPNTLFHRYPPAVPDADVASDMQEMVEDELAGAGYSHYETSAFARKGMRCRHNLNYWFFGDYLGIGAGAHSKLSLSHKILRQMRYKQPRAYMEQAEAGQPVQEQHEVAPEDLGFEFMMNALRLTEGVPVSLFAERAGLPITAVEVPLAEAERRELIRRDHLHLRPTDLGRRFLNDLLALFLPAGR